MERILALQELGTLQGEDTGGAFLCSTCSETQCQGTTCTDTCGWTSAAEDLDS